jgi:hypothetical protein
MNIRLIGGARRGDPAAVGILYRGTGNRVCGKGGGLFSS